MCLKKVLLILFSIWGTLAYCQQLELSPLAKISVLTIGPGDELDSKFGHSALRIQDPTIGMDVVYNYGMFDFYDPNFYLKFTRGKLDYWIAKQTFDRFLFSYEREKRWVKEQILNLSADGAKGLFEFLENNYLPENRYYKYDFFFDNCTTRLPDALQAVLGSKLHLAEVNLGEETTYRDLIHQNLELNSWSNLGIDLALGAVIDKPGTPFLPINLLEQLSASKINGEPLVYKEVSVLPEGRTLKAPSIFTTPLFWLGILMLVVLAVTYKDFKSYTRSRWLDFILFFATGLVGSLILFLWFGTDHLATKLNLNALWAFAPNLFLSFMLLKKQLPNWLKFYLSLLLALLGAVIILWLLQKQVFSPLILFVLVALGIRYLLLLKISKLDKFEGLPTS